MSVTTVSCPARHGQAALPVAQQMLPPLSIDRHVAPGADWEQHTWKAPVIVTTSHSAAVAQIRIWPSRKMGNST